MHFAPARRQRQPLRLNARVAWGERLSMQGVLTHPGSRVPLLYDGRSLTVRGAALDVFWNEPEVDPRLARAPNVLPLPHIGSATVETRGAMLDLQRRNLDAVLAGRPIEVFNQGRMRRDFTYIDDIVEGVIRTLDHVAEPNGEWSGSTPDPGTSKAPYRLYNIGSNNPVELSRFIEIIEERVGKKAQKNLLPLQPGDVPATYANVDDLIDDVGYKPATPVEEGIARFVDWYRDFYNV